MPRVRKPASPRVLTIRVETHNKRHLEAEARRLGVSWSTVFNAALEFVRTAGLPLCLQARLTEKFQHRGCRGVTLLDELRSVIWDAAMRLPKVPWPPADPFVELDRNHHETSTEITGPNRDYLSQRARKRDFTAVLNAEILFARILDLSPELAARLQAHLERTGMSAREWASPKMLREALPLEAFPANNY